MRRPVSGVMRWEFGDRRDVPRCTRAGGPLLIFSAGGPAFGLAKVITAEGAPSLRFLQGRIRCCRYQEECRTSCFQRPWFPPFAQNAKDGASSGFAVPERSKAGPPAHRTAIVGTDSTADDKTDPVN